MVDVDDGGNVSGCPFEFHEQTKDEQSAMNESHLIVVNGLNRNIYHSLVSKSPHKLRDNISKIYPIEQSTHSWAVSPSLINSIELHRCTEYNVLTWSGDESCYRVGSWMELK